MWRSNSKLKASASVSMTSEVTLSVHSSKKTLWSPSSKHSMKFFYKDVNKEEWVNKQKLTIKVFSKCKYKLNKLNGNKMKYDIHHNFCCSSLLNIIKCSKETKLCYLPEWCKTLNLWKYFLEALRQACLCFCILFQIREPSHQTPQT